MAILDWGNTPLENESRGVEKTVLYTNGIATTWAGVNSISHQENVDVFGYFLDGSKYSNGAHLSEISGSITAYTYPPILDEQNNHAGLSYVSLGEGGRYFIHIIYGVALSMSDYISSTITTSAKPEMIKFDLETNRNTYRDLRSSSYVVIDSKGTSIHAMEKVQNALYGTLVSDPYLPTVDELYELYESSSILRIIDHGDGRWTAEGPDSAISILDGGTFQINWPSAVFIDNSSYRISSL